jgi:hypothetical protein
MPACKNDAARTYVGLGYCASRYPRPSLRERSSKFYATKLTEDDYQALATDLPNWNPLHVGTTMASFKKAVKTYGDCKAQYNAPSGFRRALTGELVYVPDWSS